MRSLASRTSVYAGETGRGYLRRKWQRARAVAARPHAAMITVEYRIPIPVSLDEYNKALRYVIARVAESTTGEPGEGVEILVSEPFGPDNELGMREGGVHTEKLLRFRSRMPALMRRIIPTSVTEIHESSWFSNANGSRCKTVYRNPFLGDRFYLSIESNHVAGVDTEENAVELAPEQLARREVVYLDIAANVPAKLLGEDPSTFVSEKTGRGRLLPGWWNAVKAAEKADAELDADAELSVRQTKYCMSKAEAHPGACIETTLSKELADASLDQQPRCRRKRDTASGVKAAFAEHTVEKAASSSASAFASMSETESDASSVSQKSAAPIDPSCTMTCYKVVNVEFTGFGMRRFVQGWITRAVVPNGFVDIHRKLFCWMDEWFGLKLCDIEAVETEAARNIRARFDKMNGIEPGALLPSTPCAL
jgi:Phosphatidylinositol transfer protein